MMKNYDKLSNTEIFQLIKDRREKYDKNALDQEKEFFRKKRIRYLLRADKAEQLRNEGKYFRAWWVDPGRYDLPGD